MPTFSKSIRVHQNHKLLLNNYKSIVLVTHTYHYDMLRRCAFLHSLVPGGYSNKLADEQVLDKIVIASLSFDSHFLFAFRLSTFRCSYIVLAINDCNLLTSVGPFLLTSWPTQLRLCLLKEFFFFTFIYLLTISFHLWWYYVI